MKWEPPEELLKIKFNCAQHLDPVDGPRMKSQNIFVKVAKHFWRRNKGSGWLVLCVGMDCCWRCLYRLDLLVTGPGPTTNPLQISSHSHHCTTSINWDKVRPDTAPGQHYYSAGITRLAFSRMWYINRSQILIKIFNDSILQNDCDEEMYTWYEGSPGSRKIPDPIEHLWLAMWFIFLLLHTRRQWVYITQSVFFQSGKDPITQL